MGMSTVPLSELYAGAEQFLREHGGEVHLQRQRRSAEWDEETSQWTLATRAGALVADFLVLALPFEATAKLMPHMPPADGAEALAAQIDAPRALAHLQCASLVRPRDHGPRPRRPARPRDSLDVQQEPPAAVAQDEGQLPRAGGQRLAHVRRARAASRPSSRRCASLPSSFPPSPAAKLEKAALVKEVRATFGVPPGIDASGPTPRRRRGPTAFLPATGSRPAGPRPWKAPRAAATWRQKRSAHGSSERPRSFLNPDLKPRGI